MRAHPADGSIQHLQFGSLSIILGSEILDHTRYFLCRVITHITHTHTNDTFYTHYDHG